MSADLTLALIDAAATAIAENAEELTRLDQAIGDGDHGSNMQRGLQAILRQREALAALGPGEALQKAGMTLVTTVGGASGPLYGSLLMAVGKAAQAGKGWAEACAEGVEAVKRRGKSDVGAKTMLDVLVPVVEALAAGKPLAELRLIATASREATKEMLATRGRASFLGERSRGHYDPGATSTQLLIHAVCDVLEARA
jgi:phosphoenolpyruvate---glycerone phosphotransferase subunit DhaL